MRKIQNYFDLLASICTDRYFDIETLTHVNYCLRLDERSLIEHDINIKEKTLWSLYLAKNRKGNKSVERFFIYNTIQ